MCNTLSFPKMQATVGEVSLKGQPSLPQQRQQQPQQQQQQPPAKKKPKRPMVRDETARHVTCGVIIHCQSRAKRSLCRQFGYPFLLFQFNMCCFHSLTIIFVLHIISFPMDRPICPTSTSTSINSDSRPTTSSIKRSAAASSRSSRSRNRPNHLPRPPRRTTA